MFRIGIDARLYNHTGVGVYLRNLLYFLEKIPADEYIFYVYLMKEDFSGVTFKKSNFVKIAVSSRWHSLSEQLDFVKNLYLDSLDLVHFTYFSYPVLYRKKFISTIHDTTPLTFKTGRASTRNPILYQMKHLAFRFVLSQQIKNAYAVITPTKTVKEQLVKYYGQKYKKKIYPIYEGVNYELMKLDVRSEKLDESGKKSSNLQPPIYISKPFFIYIGNFYPHKNVERLIKAFAQVKTKTKLVLIGPDDYFAKRLYRYIDISIRERVIFYYNASREDLVFFYKNALAIIHPSLSEGFGLPLIEAVYFNLPIIASKIEVFRELIGNRYLSFDPLSVEDIAEKIQLYLGKRIKVDYGNILNKFSFEKMSRDTYKLYKSSLEIYASGR